MARTTLALFCRWSCPFYLLGVLHVRPHRATCYASGNPTLGTTTEAYVQAVRDRQERQLAQRAWELGFEVKVSEPPASTHETTQAPS